MKGTNQIMDANGLEIQQPTSKNPGLKPSTNPSERVFKDLRPALITGGAGFIGTNLAHRLLSAGRPVVIFDNLSRSGVELNLNWLRQEHGELVQVEVADVRDTAALERAIKGVSHVFHLAAQVAVTSSLTDPVYDFQVNALGTLNLLEVIRRQPAPPSLIFTSTNKVYGGLEDIGLELSQKRYQPTDPQIKWHGISEARSLDFHSPYGCSKGSADQYVIDYARTYGINAVVFRMSCTFGPHQFGTEDQGWVAHFLIKALKGQPIILYGDGMQVRDILYVDDLVNALVLAQANMGRLTGQAFNIGGGPNNCISLLELLDLIRQLKGGEVAFNFDKWRPGDQRYYVSDTSKFNRLTGWEPKMNAAPGVKALYDWLYNSGEAISPIMLTGRRSA